MQLGGLVLLAASAASAFATIATTPAGMDKGSQLAISDATDIDEPLAKRVTEAVLSIVTIQKTVTALPTGTTTVTMTGSTPSGETGNTHSSVPSSQTTTEITPDPTRSSTEGIVVTTVATQTTVYAIVTASNHSDKLWTSTIVISGQGSSTYPMEASGNSSSGATPKSYSTGSVGTSNTNTHSFISATNSTSKGLPLPSSVWSSTLTPSKVTTQLTTSPPLETGTSPKPQQSTTTVIGSGTNGIGMDGTRIPSAILALLGSCFELALLLWT